MPLYEYQCDSCGAVFEKMQKFADEPLKVHEDCGGPVHRLLTAPAFQFKGTGWYITDYARKSGANGGGKSSSETKTESTASKTETPAASSSTTTTDTKSSSTKSSSDK